MQLPTTLRLWHKALQMSSGAGPNRHPLDIEQTDESPQNQTRHQRSRRRQATAQAQRISWKNSRVERSTRSVGKDRLLTRGGIDVLYIAQGVAEVLHFIRGVRQILRNEHGHFHTYFLRQNCPPRV